MGIDESVPWRWRQRSRSDQRTDLLSIKVGRHACTVKIIEKFGMLIFAERKGEAKGIGIATGIKRPAMDLIK